MDTYIYIITKHCSKFLRFNRMFYNEDSFVSPMHELIHKFTNIDNEKRLSHNFYLINDFEELIEWRFRKIINNLILDHHLNKDQLYELTQFIINNFKPDYTFEDKVYEKALTIYPLISEFVDNLSKKYFIHYSHCRMNYEIIALLLNITNYNDYKIVCGHGQNIHDTDSYKKLLSLNVAATLIMNSMDEYDINNIHMDNNILDKYDCNIIDDKEERYHKLLLELYKDNIYDVFYIEDLEKFISFPNLHQLRFYDSEIYIRPFKSFIGDIINVMENSDQETIHKYILKGIDDKSIAISNRDRIFGKLIYIDECVEYYFNNDIDDDSVCGLCIYYVSRIIPLTYLPIDFLHDNLPKLPKDILSKNEINMIRHELNFIKRYFKCVGYIAFKILHRIE